MVRFCFGKITLQNSRCDCRKSKNRTQKLRANCEVALLEIAVHYKTVLLDLGIISRFLGLSLSIFLPSNFPHMFGLRRCNGRELDRPVARIVLKLQEPIEWQAPAGAEKSQWHISHWKKYWYVRNKNGWHILYVSDSERRYCRHLWYQHLTITDLLESFS